MYENEQQRDAEARRRELRRKKRLKKKIKKYARFFGAWAILITVVVLVIVGIFKIGGAIVDAINGDPEEEVLSEEVKTSEEGSDSTTITLDENGELLPDTTIDPKVYEFAVPGEKGLIIVDAGHGGYDGGADGGGVYEKDINLDIAYWVKEELELRGYAVYMTRTDDSYVGLSKRAELANAQTEALAFVSVHQNSVEDHNYICGVEGWTHEREGCEALAGALSAGVAAQTGAEDRGVAFRKALVVCRDTTMPAAIIECGYMSNPDECAHLQDSDYQVNVARGIVNGIDSFVAMYYNTHANE